MHKGRRLRTVAVVLFVIGLALSAFMVPTAMAQSDNPCPPGDSGKIDTVGDPETVPFTAPEGKLIWQYCVKAGSDGYVLVPVEPPSASVTIDHPTKDSVSNYSLFYVDEEPPEECPEGQTGTFPDCEEPPEECPEGTTGTPPDCEEPPEECPEGTTGTPPDCVGGTRTDRPAPDDPDDPEVADDPEDKVLGKRQVKGRALPFTGIDPAPFLALSSLLAASGASALVIARRK
jgi:hypothetical protein